MAQRTVLVVDDDRSILEVMRGALEDEGYRTITTNGASALAVAEAEQPRLILLDLMMPDLDGVQVSRLLRASSATAHIPIVATSAYLRQAAPADLQIDDWLSKPFDLEQLYEVVARWAGSA